MAVIYRSGPKAVKNVFSLAAMFLSSISLMHFVVPKAGRYLFEVMIAEVENLGYQRIPKGGTCGGDTISINYKHGIYFVSITNTANTRNDSPFWDEVGKLWGDNDN